MAFRSFLIKIALMGLALLICHTAGFYEVQLDKLLPAVALETSIQQGGALIAIRVPQSKSDLKWPASLEHRQLLKAVHDKQVRFNSTRVCYAGECMPVGPEWVFFASPPEAVGTQKVLIFQSNLASYKSFKLNPGPFHRKETADLRLPTAVRKRVDNQEAAIEKERIHNFKVLTHVTETPLPTEWQTPILHPVIISPYGSTRTPPDGETYAHRGTDMRAAMGTPIMASARGVVADISLQVLGGQTITIDHGQGIMTRYLHLSHVLVTPGQSVEKGEKIALSGATGRVEAPHFHWEMRIRSVPVDPLSGSLLLERLLDPKSDGFRAPSSAVPDKN